MLYGAPPVVKQTIIVDEEGISIEYANEGVFEIKTSPVALCRCGNSKTLLFVTEAILTANLTAH